jgi:hypothetical protein
MGERETLTQRDNETFKEFEFRASLRQTVLKLKYNTVVTSSHIGKVKNASKKYRHQIALRIHLKKEEDESSNMSKASDKK